MPVQHLEVDFFHKPHRRLHASARLEDGTPILIPSMPVQGLEVDPALFLIVIFCLCKAWRWHAYLHPLHDCARLGGRSCHMPYRQLHACARFGDGTPIIITSMPMQGLELDSSISLITTSMPVQT